ncbi:mucin-2 [Microplitis mediator]|uniref:mucin-2 n=1 Tax=Microplitis mediator TaxID=375433 RepID=UPI00255292BF|nr:mucin-2 [Microplitis mediator]
MSQLIFALLSLLLTNKVISKPYNEWRVRETPVNIMTDVINDLGVNLLNSYDNYNHNDGNVAFSPTGLAFVLVALYEAAAGNTRHQIQGVMGLPQDRRVTRIGLRDIHRRLRSYLNANAFLGGLTLNRDDITLRTDYEDILRFYGFDLINSTIDNTTTAIPSPFPTSTPPPTPSSTPPSTPSPSAIPTSPPTPPSSSTQPSAINTSGNSTISSTDAAMNSNAGSLMENISTISPDIELLGSMTTDQMTNQMNAAGNLSMGSINNQTMEELKNFNTTESNLGNSGPESGSRGAEMRISGMESMKAGNISAELNSSRKRRNIEENNWNTSYFSILSSNLTIVRLDVRIVTRNPEIQLFVSEIPSSNSAIQGIELLVKNSNSSIQELKTSIFKLKFPTLTSQFSILKSGNSILVSNTSILRLQFSILNSSSLVPKSLTLIPISDFGIPKFNYSILKLDFDIINPNYSTRVLMTPIPPSESSNKELDFSIQNLQSSIQKFSIFRVEFPALKLIPIRIVLIPQSQWSISTSKVSIPVSESSIPVSESSIPTSESSIPVSESLIPTSESSIPVSEISIPTPQSSIPTPQFSIPVSESSIPVSESSIPTSESSIPVSESLIPTSEFSIPVSEISISTLQSSIPTPQFSIPVSESSIPVSEFSIPVSEFSIPVSESSIPTSEFSIPVSEISIPTLQSSIPTPQFSIPVSEFSIPVSESSISTSESSIPVSEFSIPVSEISIPLSKTQKSPKISSNSNPTRKRRNLDENIWFHGLEESNPWKGSNPIVEPVDGLDTEDQKQTELNFLTNGNELVTITTMTYTTVLPFCYFPSLHAAGLEFPLDDPRYTIMILVPDGNNLLRDLRGIKLRKLRQALTPNWVRATIPSFMLKGFVTLTGWLQKLGIQDAFEPRAADLSLMSPDLGIYARDVQQSIGVNIRNFAEAEVNATKITGNNNPSTRDPIPFVVDRPFIFFIIDTETSVSLIAGRVNDPLNSRII